MVDEETPDKVVDISTVIAIYKAEKTLDELYRRLSGVLDSMTDSWEMVLVNDGSPDESWEKLKKEFTEVRALAWTPN